MTLLRNEEIIKIFDKIVNSDSEIIFELESYLTIKKMI